MLGNVHPMHQQPGKGGCGMSHDLPAASVWLVTAACKAGGLGSRCSEQSGAVSRAEFVKGCMVLLSPLHKSGVQGPAADLHLS